MDKDKYFITKSISSEKRSINFNSLKKKLKPLNITTKYGKNNFNIKSEKIAMIKNNGNNNNNKSKIVDKKISSLNNKKLVINNTLINKKIKISSSTEKNGNHLNQYQKNTLLKHYYFSLNKNNNPAHKLKATNTLLPYIDRLKLK